MDYFTLLFLLVINVGFLLYNRETSPKTSSAFTTFQWTYLIPYFVLVASDWLQGPYVYALYESYGFEIGEIGILFIAGFGSSMVFGTIVGSVSDKYGRKKSCLFYVVLYTISCTTKHFPNFAILFLGRITGGIATSILFSAFESWMVSEHFSRGFPTEWLNYTFYLQVFGNGITAILSGIVASFVKEYFRSFVAPFDTAIVLLLIGGLLIYFYWNENYGDQEAQWSQSFSAAFNTLRTDMRVACLGVAQSFFEAAMYIFVFMWTPVLDQFFFGYSHGIVFACYMVCVMIGSSVFKLTSTMMRLESLLAFVFVAAVVSLAAVFVHSSMIVLGGFFVYEMCVGAFWPSMGTLKGKYVPESVRATVMNYFRIPTNLFVVAVLNQVKNLHFKTVFSIAIGLVLIALVAQLYVMNSTEGKKEKEEPIVTEIVTSEPQVPLDIVQDKA